MTLVTDENGVIKGEENLSPAYFEIASSNIISPESEPGRTKGSFGNEGSKLCCADHVHRHTNAWYGDADIRQLENKLDAIQLAFEREIDKDLNKAFGLFLDIGKRIVEFGIYCVVVISEELAKVSPSLINFLIRLLNRMVKLGIKEVEVDGENVDVKNLSEELEKTL